METIRRQVFIGYNEDKEVQMNRSIAFVIFFTLAINACGPSQEQIQATVQVSIEQTQNAIPTATLTSVPTNTPEPTSTPEPSPTPIVLPDTLYRTFSGISIITTRLCITMRL